MFSKYVEYKLKNKVITYLKLAGFTNLLESCPNNMDVKPLIEKVKELGNYRIIWKQNVAIDINMLPHTDKIKVVSGKYHIFDESGYFKAQLFSSEFIEFNIEDMREYKLNKILNK